MVIHFLVASDLCGLILALCGLCGLGDGQGGRVQE